jgi:hypothetical protein
MTIFNALFCAAFLILVAASAAVTGSMAVLALFDLAFGKKSKPPLVAADGELPQAARVVVEGGAVAPLPRQEQASRVQPANGADVSV